MCGGCSLADKVFMLPFGQARKQPVLLHNVGNFVFIGNLCCFHSNEFKTNVSNLARRKSICGKKHFRFSADGCGMRRYFVHFHYKVFFAVFSGNGDHCAGVCNWRVVLPDVKGHFQTGNIL